MPVNDEEYRDTSGLGSERAGGMPMPTLKELITYEHGHGTDASLIAQIIHQYNTVYSKDQIDAAKAKLRLPPKGYSLFDPHEDEIRKMWEGGT